MRKLNNNTGLLIEIFSFNLVILICILIGLFFIKNKIDFYQQKNEKRISELEFENAELKKNVEMYRDYCDNMVEAIWAGAFD